MKLYIAGKFSEKVQIRKYMDDAVKLGHTITHDWTQSEQDGDGVEKMKNSAEKDIQAVKDCDCIIIILTDPKYAYRGTFTELGCSLGLEKKVIIVSQPDPNNYYWSNCFYHHHAIVHVETWKEAIEKMNN